MAHEVRDPLAHLVVEDAVVLLDVLVDARVALLEEALAPDLALGYGRVGYGELHGGLRAEVVVELAHRREHRLLVLLACGLVADVPELDGLAEQALLDLRGAVDVHSVVADRGEDVFGLGAGAPLAASRLLDFLRLFLESRRAGMRAAHGQPALSRCRLLLFGFLPGLIEQQHSPPPPSSSPCAWPFATGVPVRERPARPRARGWSGRGSSGPRAGSRARAGRTSRISCDGAARTPRARTAAMRT